MGRIDRAKGQDATMERRHIHAMLNNIDEYELVKSKKHPKYQTATDFYDGAKICKQNFLKYYRRFINANRELSALIPHKTGRKFKEELTYNNKLIEQLKEFRAKGFNKFDLQIKIYEKLEIKLSPSSIYRLMKKLHLNRLNPIIKETKRKIIKMQAGELGNIDIHYVAKGTVKEVGEQRLYLLGLIDAYSRVCWLEVIDSIKALDVMFASMEILMRFKDRYDIQFKAIMSDNGAEFGSTNSKEHPFAKLLTFYGIKQLHTKPCRPQTNGKIERFWKTLEEELLGGETFATVEEFKEYILGYVLYYNEQRMHQGINNIVPAKMLKQDTSSWEKIIGSKANVSDSDSEITEISELLIKN